MYWCICIHIFICININMYLHIFTSIYLKIFIHVYKYIYLASKQDAKKTVWKNRFHWNHFSWTNSLDSSVNIYIYIYIYIHICVYIRVCTLMDIHIHHMWCFPAWIILSSYIHTYILIYMYIHTYTSIHIDKFIYNIPYQ
jgi:hypothetical protein